MRNSLHQNRADITRRALVVGGGLSGMTAARAIAAQGFEAVIVEKEKELGGNLRRIHFTEHSEPHALLADLISQVENDPKIRIYRSTEIKKMSGFIGNYITEISTSNREVETIQHGVTIIATGGIEYRPTEYLYSQSSRVITQLEFEKKLIDRDSSIQNLRSVAMIQCVGSRETEHLYCSRVCCSQAINNAIKLKEIYPELDISILYRDIRSYGMHELQYRKARESGITFIHFDSTRTPEVSQDQSNLQIKVLDKALNRELILHPDLLILSAAIRPQPDIEQFASKLKLPLTLDKFVMEAHMKLRPLDLVNEGMFVCGLAHSPKTIPESIAQARGAASRAITVLSQPSLMVGGIISVVDAEKCAACLTCVRACPYEVPLINAEGAAYIEAAACQGCGICASVCPRKAITLQHYSDEQILAKTRVLIEASPGIK